MPGIYVYVKNTRTETNQLGLMSQAMKLYDHFKQDRLFEDDCIGASRVHLGHVGEQSSPYQKGSVRIWVEGEAYNHAEVAQDLGLREKGFAASLVEAYRNDKLDSFLNRLDGYFCASLYDSEKKSLKLISDRYGLRMLYWYFKDGLFTWSSEVKGILALEVVDKTIDATSLPCFMGVGYLLGDHTWFEHIKLIKPATVMEFDFISQTVNEHYYWKWSEIKPSSLSFDHAVARLGELFIEAVKKRFDPNAKVGIALSGGLDSRAIFAAVNYLYPDYEGYAYTFGKPDCDDIKIAQQVIARSNWKHKVFYFSDKNWFAPRFENIWNTDGMLDMMHMHGSEFLDEISQNMVVNLNGYAGDAILGGGFLSRVSLDSRITEKNSFSFYNEHSKHANLDSEFYDIKHVEPNLHMNRGRRFANMGSVNELIKIDQRKPFIDNAVVELVFSLPDEYRFNNKLYSAMLQKYFPKYFKDIPWQKTGKPSGITKIPTIPARAFNKAKRIASRLFGMASPKDYTDYPNWIRSEEIARNLDALLTREGSCYTKHTEEDFRQKYLLPHLSKNAVDNSDQILRAATFEIYLRKLHGSSD